MKTITAIALLTFAFSSAVTAVDHTTEIKDVHLCCKGCSTAVEQAVSKIPGANVKVDRDAGTVTLSGADSATVQKAADAIVAAGFFGKSSDRNLKLRANTGAKGKEVKSIKVEGVHLCCGQCVEAVDKATASVEGVKGHTAIKGAKSFEVNGSFNDEEFMQALQKQGVSGKIAK